MAEHTPSNRLAADQPTRGADRNQALADQTDPTTEEMLLPQLDDGITLLDVEGGRGVPILQSLVLDHLLLHDGPAFWVDANGHATTATLAQISPLASGCSTGFMSHVGSPPTNTTAPSVISQRQ